MISFFRRLRNGHIGSGSWAKYLLYAVGETMLVVVGILIALQVNNWNLERLDRQREQDILQDLKVEFEANLFDLRRTIAEHRVIYYELREIQRITLAEKYTDDRLDSLTHGITKWFTFTDRPGASTNLINSGNLNLISNDELRDLITQWSGTVNDIVDDEVYVTDFTRETMLPFLAAHYPVTNQEPVNKSNLINYGVDLGIDVVPVFPIKPVNWKKLLTNEEFQSLLSIRMMYETHSIAEAQKGLEFAERILELIEEDLN